MLARARGRVDAQRSGERVRVTDALAAPGHAVVRERIAQQRLDLVHQARVVEADSVPLEQRELGLVPPAELVVAKHAADLIDVAAAGREQALHRVLRRRM